MCFGADMIAQDRRISGKIVSAGDDLHPGVSVQIKGTGKGASTDATGGNYSIAFLKERQP
jgi:hypothetical protein